MKNILLTLLALCVTAGVTAAPVFRNPLPVGIGIEYSSVMEAGDFNGDGHQDVLSIYSHEAKRVLSVLLANGTGPFAAPVLTTIDTGYSPYAVAVGDVNEDGKSDLVLIQSETNSLAVMFANDNGTFTHGPTIPGSTPLAPVLTLADFNGDQNLDIAAGGSPSSTQKVAIHFGNGAGTFSAAIATTANSGHYFRTFDINADGKTDLFVGGENRLYLGNGSGGFTFKSAVVGTAVVPGDFNHDGKLDLAASAGDTHDWYVQVWLGSGDGTLTGGAKYPSGYSASGFAAADVDADGNLDLLTVSYQSAVTVLRGKADGTFHKPDTWVGGPTSRSILTGDFDRDGKIDFITSATDRDLHEIDRISFIRGNGDGTFRTSRLRHTGSVVPVRYPSLGVIGGTVADMNGDQHPDVVIAQDKPEGGVNNSDFGVLLNDGTGKLGAPMLMDPGIPKGRFALGDVNNDGKTDAVIVASPFYDPIPRTLLGNGDGTFATPIPLSVTDEGDVFLGNYTGDANLDLFVHSSWFFTVYPGNGSGTFGTGIRTELTFNTTPTVADLNADGKMDFVGAGSYQKYSFVNDGTGRFTKSVITTMDLEAGALADFNGDGKIDLLTTTYLGTETWLGNGDGTFAPPIAFVITPRPGGRGVTADFDGDGKLDVAFGPSIFLGTGDGRFRSRSRVHMREFNTSNAADMDGNGSPDLVTSSSSADQVGVFLTRTGSDPTATASVTLTSSQAIGQYGLGMELTATVTGGSVPLTGAVTFAVDGTPRGIVALDTQGKAIFSTAFEVGSFNVTATYAGDENYLSATKSMTQIVSKGKPVASISGFPNPRPYRQTVTIHADVIAPYSYGFVAPSGPITLRDGNTPLNLTLTNGKTTTKDLSIGSHVISVDYAGDANYEAATASYTQVITKPVPTVMITTTPSSPIYAGAPVTIRASLYSITSATGTFTFLLNDVVQATVPLTNGAAELQLTLPWGYHLVQARYSGDDTWASSLGSKYADVLAGPWGTPVTVDATAYNGNLLNIRWSKVNGGVTYTLWRKKTLHSPWEMAGTHPANAHNTSTTMDEEKTWMFAATVTDANGNVSPMGPVDLATAVAFTDPTIVNYATTIKATHVHEVRTAIASVRTFAGLAPFSYTNAIAAGQLIRASDMQQMRTALAQARSTIGLPPISFVDPTLTPSASFVFAMHVGQLRAGTN